MDKVLELAFVSLSKERTSISKNPSAIETSKAEPAPSLGLPPSPEFSKTSSRVPPPTSGADGLTVTKLSISNVTVVFAVPSFLIVPVIVAVKVDVPAPVIDGFKIKLVSFDLPICC